VSSIQLSELQKPLGLPRRIELSRPLWAAATVLGLLRTAVNDEYRKSRRNRGERKNELNDLQGALGELVGLEVLDRAGLSKGSDGLLDLQRSVDRPDLVATTEPPTPLDVKCHFDEKPKKLFLVNEDARIRSINRGVQGFLPIISAKFRKYASLGRLIPIEDLTEWELKTVGIHRDPCRLIQLTVLDQRFLGAKRFHWKGIRVDKQWGPEVFTPDEAQQLQEIDRADLLDRVRQSPDFSLDGLQGEEARTRLVALLPPEIRRDLDLD
jgi:hypothetical protein